MSRFTKFARGASRGASIDWVVLGAGVLLLGVMVVYDIYKGARYDLPTRADYTASAPTAGVQSGGERTPS